MPKANQECLVIYSAGTSRIRRIASSTEKSMDRLKVECPCSAGEASSVLPWTSMAEVQDAVVQVTGISVGNDRYVCVDHNGEVDQVLRCDPECGDLVQGHTMERHDTARVGWRQMIDGSWQRSADRISKDLEEAEAGKVGLEALEVGAGITQAQIDAAIADAASKLVALRQELADREAPR